MRRVSFLWVAAILAAASASAQSSSSPSPFKFSLASSGESRSDAFQLLTGDGSGSAPALSGNPAAGGSGGGAGQQNHGWKNISSHGFAFDLGGGFNAPIGNDISKAYGGPFVTWGGNLTAGGGLRFSKRLSLLGEFQFIDDKLPASFIAEAGAGATNGNTYIVALTAEPVLELFPKRTFDAYLTGGGGYYHKSTNFNVQTCCDFYGYPISVNTNSFSSNQAGGNLGFGLTRRVGGVYGDGKMKLFAEARYLFIDTPPVSQTNGLGKTELIPVTFGVRF
jgi:hypothetical protein